MKKYWLLALALLVGAFLRLHSLADIPPGFTWDEAALGYNAYSILKTGKDEFGKFMPIIFKSFGDFKPGLYVYLALPSIALFGLNEFATRLPSAIAGIVAIWGIYLLVGQATKSRRAASFSALALALMPWHIHFSRGAWEANLFTTLLIFAIFYAIRFFESKSRIFPPLVLACATLVTYQAAKLVTPMVFLLLIVVYWTDLTLRLSTIFKKKIDYLHFSLILLFGVWVYLGSLFGPAGNRLARLSIFGYKPEITQEIRNIDDNNQLSINLFHNQAQLTTKLVLSRYLYHFSPEVLFYEGGTIADREHIPGTGVLNPLEIFWLVFGASALALSFKEKWAKLFLGLFILAPIPASMTLSEFSTVRSLFLVVPLAIISGLGMELCLRKMKYIFWPILAVYLIMCIYIFDLYSVHAKFTVAKEFLYGYRQALEVAKKYPDSRIVMTDVLGQPYIYYLFYSAYDPATYQKNNRFISGGIDVGRVESVGLAEFHQFGPGDIEAYKNTVFIGTSDNIKDDYDLSNPVIDAYHSVSYPGGKQLFRIIKTK